MATISTRNFIVPLPPRLLSSQKTVRRVIGRDRKSNVRTCQNEAQVALEDIQKENQRLQAQLESAQEIEKLRQENASLRKIAFDKMQEMGDAELQKFQKQHEQLVDEAASVGLQLPNIQNNQIQQIQNNNHLVEQEQVQSQENTPVQPQEKKVVSKKVFKDQFSVEHEGSLVRVSVDEQDALTFSFDDAAEEEEDDNASGGGKNVIMAISVESSDSQDDQTAVKDPVSDGVITLQDDSGLILEQVQLEDEQVEEGEQQEIDYIDGIPVGFWPKQQQPVAQKGLSEQGKATLRQAAEKEVSSCDVSELVGQRSDWLWFTVPQIPVAGAKCVMYFNREQSQILRHRPRLQCQLSYNTWELEGEKLNLVKQEVEGDWWGAEFVVPTNVYEMNFVYSDAEGLYDNNFGQDFYSKVDAGITQDEWIAGAPERLYQEMLIKTEREEKAAKEAERIRLIQAEKQDKERAIWFLTELKQKKEWLLEGATKEQRIDDKPAWSATNLKRYSTGKLVYNSKLGPLQFLDIPQDQNLTLRIGTNDWQQLQDIQMTRFKNPYDPKNDHWWQAEFQIPFDAIIMSFVVNFYEHWDNNNGGDHRILVPLPSDKKIEDWIDSLEEQFYLKEKELRIQQEKLNEKREEKARRVRLEAQQEAKKVQQQQMRFVLFTEPANLQAGKKVSIYYNPNNTHLAGRDAIFINGGWNRWTHQQSFGPIRLIHPGETGDHFRVTLDVPVDAHTIDFVFSDVPSGDGSYDNRGGLDYHIPIEGSVQQETPLHVVHVSVEMAPICKVGGLADVVTSLGRAVQDQGHIVEVILPKYEFLNHSPLLSSMQFEAEFDWGGTKILVCSCIVEGLRCFFVEPRNGFFHTQSVYGRKDDEQRFDFFCKAALEFLLQTHRHPDILHCHDWSTAQVAQSYWEDYHLYGMWKPRVVFTIHNLNYGQKKIADAAHHSQFFTTVSPTYAFETGGNPIINPHVAKFRGVRNGIDLDIWDPENDQFLPLPYNYENFIQGKQQARQQLRERLGLGGGRDCPLIGVVSRLTTQKGIHLIKHTAWRAIDRGCQFILLGSAPDPKIQEEFNTLANQLQGENARFCFTYDEPLSHLIYAACDMVVVPSMFEPCGLTQMIAMRYGAIPVVRHTGGLRDTVFDVDNDKARAAWEQQGSVDWQTDNVDATNGFAFEGTDPGALDYALNRAVDSWYNDRPWFQSLQQRVMQQDWSWNRPAIDYIELYHASRKR